MATSAKRKTSTTVNDILSDVTRARAVAKTSEPKEADPRFADIESNPFYQVMFDPKATAKQKAERFAALMVFTGTKEESREHIAQQELFKEYLQSVREEMATEIISLTNTDAFSELKDTYSQLNQGLIDFENQMGPLTDIIDAVYKLRTSGMTLDAFKTIIEDKKREDERAAAVEEMTKKAEESRTRIRALEDEAAALKTKRGLFGFGGLTQEAKEQIAVNESHVNTELTTLSENLKQIDELRASLVTDEDADPDFIEQKNKLRELLDISSEEHKERQQALVDAALNFVKTSKTRIGSIRDHLGQMGGQIEGLADANDSMSSVYAIMQDGLKVADKKNREILSAYEVAPTNEDAVDKMTRESTKLLIDQHIKAVETSSVDTMTTYSDLTSQAVRIKGMRDNNADNTHTARLLHNQGVAGVADRLSTVLQAVSMAALGESSSMAGQTLQRMRDSTNAVTQKEAIRQAMGVTEQSDALSKVIDDLAGYGQVINTATDITKEGLTSMRQRMEELEVLTGEVKKSTQRAYAVNADLTKETAAVTAKPVTTKKSPFGGLGKV